MWPSRSSLGLSSETSQEGVSSRRVPSALDGEGTKVQVPGGKPKAQHLKGDMQPGLTIGEAQETRLKLITSNRGVLQTPVPSIATISST